MTCSKNTKRKEEKPLSEQIIKNNVAELIGVVKTGFTFSHEIYGESFYSFVMEVARLSNSSDQIPMLVSERLMNVQESLDRNLFPLHGFLHIHQTRFPCWYQND